MATPSTISSENACQNCDKPATRICGSCKDAPVLASEQIQAIYYCSESCESTHYPHHKELCEKLRMRRTLFRAADTIQQAFLILREQCYEKIISSVTTNGIVTNLNEMWPSTDQINSRFPNELFTNARDRAAVLTFNSCVDGVAHTYELVKAALRGKVNPDSPQQMLQCYHTVILWHDVPFKQTPQTYLMSLPNIFSANSPQ